jgi:hypothetical protein
MSEEHKWSHNLPPEGPKRYGLNKAFLKYLAAFVSGVVVSFVITYLVVYQPFANIGASNTPTQKSPQATSSSQAPQVPPALKVEKSPTAKSQVSEKEVQEYSETIDCSTLANNSKLTIDASRVLMKSIDLERGQVNVQFFENPAIRSMNYLSLPEVVDHKCNTIKLSDLRAEQTIRLYDYNAEALKAEPEKKSYIFLIQKITR